MGLAYNVEAHAGIARRAGRSPSEARKLPEQKPRSPPKMSETGKPKRGASGGMQGGPRRGRSPITGPGFRPPQAPHTTPTKRPPYPQGTKIPSHRTSPALFSMKPQLCEPQRTFPHNNRQLWDSIQPTRCFPPFHPALYRPLALRGAQGDRRAQRGSSRSRSRAALAE